MRERRAAEDQGKLPKVSVITVVYNGVAEIARTIDSTLSQDYANVEYVVIDGQSSDGTLSIIDHYGAAIDVVVSERDNGIYDAMNKGIVLSTGEFLLFMNCGDVFFGNNSLSSMMALIAGGSAQVVCGNWVRRSNRDPDVLCQPDLERGLFNHQAIVYSRSLHAIHGLYANVRGLTTADYLFFATLRSSPTTTWRLIDTAVAIVDITGISAGSQTLSQKYAIDYLCGRVSKAHMLMVLMAHPLYSWLKRSLKRLRRLMRRH